MASILILSVFLLVSVGVYLLMHRNALRVVLGVSLITHAVHLLVLSAGRLGNQAPLTNLGADPLLMSDPLPQALVLTSIVISMAITLYVLAAMAAGASCGLGADLEAPPDGDIIPSGETIRTELEGRSDWREQP